jgi:hypothetical protein
MVRITRTWLVVWCATALLVPGCTKAGNQPARPASGSPCPTPAAFADAANGMAPTVFEGSSVTVTVTGDVTCTSGWAYADVVYDYAGGVARAGWVVLQYADDRWQWVVDDYWKQFGDELCSRVPDAIAAKVGCAAPSTVPSGSPCTGAGPRTIDEGVATGWDGICVPGDFCAVPGTIRIPKDGTVVESTKYREAHISASDDDRIRGDVDGDGRDEAAIYLYCHTGSGVAAGRIAVAYAIVSQRNDQLTVPGVVTAQKQDPDLMPTSFKSLTLERGKITAVEQWYRSPDPTCCPSGTATTVWTVGPDGKLTPGAPDVTG